MYSVKHLLNSPNSTQFMLNCTQLVHNKYWQHSQYDSRIIHNQYITNSGSTVCMTVECIRSVCSKVRGYISAPGQSGHIVYLFIFKIPAKFLNLKKFYHLVQSNFDQTKYQYFNLVPPKNHSKLWNHKFIEKQ